MGIELTRAEIDEYLLNSPRGILCVSRENRAPLALPMWFGWMEGRVVMTTLASSKKVPAIRKHPQVSFLVESGEEYFTLKALLLIGPCRVEVDSDGAWAAIRRMHENKPIYRRLFPESLPPHLEHLYGRPHATLSITPTSITSWNFAKVRT